MYWGSAEDQIKWSFLFFCSMETTVAAGWGVHGGVGTDGQVEAATAMNLLMVALLVLQQVGWGAVGGWGNRRRDGPSAVVAVQWLGSVIARYVRQQLNVEAVFLQSSAADAKPRPPPVVSWSSGWRDTSVSLFQVHICWSFSATQLYFNNFDCCVLYSSVMLFVEFPFEKICYIFLCLCMFVYAYI